MRFRCVTAICVLMVCSLLLASFARAQQVAADAPNRAALTNQDILFMAKSKFDDGTIVKMIQTHDANFDLSVAALVKLKDAGISQPVIQAMLATVSGRGEARQEETSATAGAAAAAAGGALANLPGLMEEVGVFVRMRGKLVAMEPEIANWRTGGVLKSMAAGRIRGM
jgi:hypothetical protein